LRTSRLLVVVLLLFSTFMVSTPIIEPAHATITVPSQDGTPQTCGAAKAGASCTVTLSSANTNDVVIVLESTPDATACSASHDLPTASGLTFSFRRTYGSQVCEFWAISASALSSKVVTCTLNAPANTYANCAAFVYTGEGTANPFDGPGCVATASAQATSCTEYVAASDLIFTIAGCNGEYAVACANPTVGTGFISIAALNTGSTCATYGCVGVYAECLAASACTSPTGATAGSQTFAYTFTTACTTGGASCYIVGDALMSSQSTSTETVTVQIHEGYSSSDNYVISGCGASVTTEPIGNASHAFTAITGATCYYAIGLGASAGYAANTGYIYASNATLKSNSVAGDTLIYDAWRVYYNTFNAAKLGSANFDSGMTFPVSIKFDGSAGTCTLPSSSYSKHCWTDYSFPVTYPQTSTGPPANSRWQFSVYATSSCPSSTTTAAITTGGNSLSCDYYKQLSIQPRAGVGNSAGQTTFISGLGSITVSITYLGTASTVACGTGGQAAVIQPTSGDAHDGCGSTAGNAVWVDYNTALTGWPSTLTGAPAGTQWTRSTTCTLAQTSGGTTPTCYYYDENIFTPQITANAQSTFDASMTAAILGYQYGSPVTLCTITTAVAATGTCSLGGAGGTDVGQSVTFPAQLSSAPAGSRWCNAGNCAATTPTITPGATVNVNYYKNLANETYCANPLTSAWDSGSYSIVVTGNYLGSPITYVTLTPSNGGYTVCAFGGHQSGYSYYVDYSPTVTYTATLNDGSNKQWASVGTTFAPTLWGKFFTENYILQVHVTLTGTPASNWDASRTINFYGVVLGTKVIPTGCSFTPTAGTSTPLSCNPWVDSGQLNDYEDSNVVSGSIWYSNPAVSAAITTPGGTYDSAYTLLQSTITTTTSTSYSTTTTATTSTQVNSTTTTATSFSTSTYATTVNGTGTTVMQVVTEWRAAVPLSTQTTASSNSTAARALPPNLRGIILIVGASAAFAAVVLIVSRRGRETQTQKATRVLGQTPHIRKVDIRRKKRGSG